MVIFSFRYSVQENVFAPEALWRLAGGGTTGSARKNSSSPERATDEASILRSFRARK
jgi:hypothetical protein